MGFIQRRLLTLCLKALIKATLGLCVAVSSVAWGQNALLELVPQKNEWLIRRDNHEQYYDPTGAFIIDVDKVQWKKPESDGVQYGYKAGAAWIRFTLHNKMTQQRRFVFYFKKPVSDLMLYSNFNGVLQEEAVVKRHDNIWQKAVPSRLSAIEFVMEPNEKRTFVARVAAVPLASAFYIMDTSRFAVWQQSETFTLSIFLGLLLGTVLFNTLLYFFVRDKIYLVYCAYGVFMLLFLATDKNVLQFILRDFITIRQNALYLVDLYVIGGMCFRFLLTKEFLSILKTYRVLDHIAKVYIFVGGTLVFLDWFVLPAVVRGITTITFALTGAFVSMGMLLLALWKKSREAYLYLVAFCAPLGGGIAMVMMRLGVLPYNIIVENGLLVGVVLEAVFLSACLGDRINLLKREKEEVQMKGLEELGRLAVQLGDRLNTPLNVIQMCAEEIMEEGVDEYIQTESLRIISQVTHISQEMAHLKALRAYAPKDSLSALGNGGSKDGQAAAQA